MQPFLNLGDRDRETLVSTFLKLTTNPYRDYVAFHEEIADLAKKRSIPDALT